MCFGAKELSQRDGSFEYPQHSFGQEIMKQFFNYALLSGGCENVAVTFYLV